MRTACLLLFAALYAAGQQKNDRPDLRELVELSGGQSALDQIFSEGTIQQQMRQLFQNAPPEHRAKADRFIAEFSKEFTAEARAQKEQLMGLVMTVYAKHYTPEDVKELVAFYKTPIGKKLAAVGPKAAIESMQVGQKWGQELGSKIGARVNARIEAEAKEKK